MTQERNTLLGPRRRPLPIRAPAMTPTSWPPTSRDERGRAGRVPGRPPARHRRGARAAADRARGQRAVGDPAFDEIFHPIARRLVERCDAVLRIGGPSAGADEMVEIAQAHGAAIYRDVGRAPVMLKQERHRRILDLLQAEGRVVADRPAGGARRLRLHGPARPGRAGRRRAGCSACTAARSPARRSPRPTTSGASQGCAGKLATARAAATLLEPGQVAIVDGGSTALALVERDPAGPPGTFVTHSPPVATALGAPPGSR